ncbi:MAG: hypothetical protein HYW48_09620 [Deltaproteobacteria bacterium]|nr:hypothetical protein [Deltaproteobacteria bacterium]
MISSLSHLEHLEHLKTTVAKLCYVSNITGSAMGEALLTHQGTLWSYVGKSQNKPAD